MFFEISDNAKKSCILLSSDETGAYLTRQFSDGTVYECELHISEDNYCEMFIVFISANVPFVECGLVKGDFARYDIMGKDEDSYRIRWTADGSYFKKCTWKVATIGEMIDWEETIKSK